MLTLADMDTTTTCKNTVCYGCEHEVQEVRARWYITINHAGFNSPANNRNGYATREAAIAASKRYRQGRG